ncbi:hypothetical protein HZS_2232, partial [Henneguya salminicola]
LKFCEIIHPCQNNGENKLILNESKSFYNCKCECKSINFGKFCQYKYRCRNCNNNVCIRNNTCLNCSSSWGGKNCQNRIIKRCNFCLNNVSGTIKLNKKKLECDCKPNFYGKYCEINCSHICSSNICSMKAIIFLD